MCAWYHSDLDNRAAVTQEQAAERERRLDQLTDPKSQVEHAHATCSGLINGVRVTWDAPKVHL